MSRATSFDYTEENGSAGDVHARLLQRTSPQSSTVFSRGYSDMRSVSGAHSSSAGHNGAAVPRGRPNHMPTLSAQMDPRSVAVAQSQYRVYDTDNASSASDGFKEASSNNALLGASMEREDDDWLHDVHDIKDATRHGSIFANGFPVRAVLNVGFLAILAIGLLLLFAGYPLIANLGTHDSKKGGFNLGGTNSTGQIASIANFPNLIDPDTPDDAQTRVGSNGQKMKLVFSDEFNQDGRSFYPGDDPFWEAVDLHYWGTNDYEWYDPAAVTTANGYLQITLSETPEHNLNFRGGMLQSWNKFCFTGGYLVASVRLPGRNDVSGLWPAFWTMGNLGRAGYGASLEGTWPYTYSACDVGTLQNQTMADGTPLKDAQGGFVAFNRQYSTSALSWAAGQRLSACTCPNDDHPGPKVNGKWVGRSAPEIDVFEAQAGTGKNGGGKRMQVSQSMQMAPFNNLYTLMNTSGAPYTLHQDSSQLNSYQGAVFQQAGSAITDIPDQTATELSGGNFSPYGLEYQPGTSSNNGYITWYAGENPSWTLNPAAFDPDPVSQISARPVAQEPMYIIFNLGISQSFGTPDFAELTFPTTMSVDWVRVYQPEDAINIGCDPDDFPTYDYINRHMEAYTNPLKTLWGGTNETGGYGQYWPRNSLDNGCSAPPSLSPGNPNAPHAKAPYVNPDDLPNY